MSVWLLAGCLLIWFGIGLMNSLLMYVFAPGVFTDYPRGRLLLVLLGPWPYFVGALEQFEEFCRKWWRVNVLEHPRFFPRILKRFDERIEPFVRRGDSFTFLYQAVGGWYRVRWDAEGEPCLRFYDAFRYWQPDRWLLVAVYQINGDWEYDRKCLVILNYLKARRIVLWVPDEHSFDWKVQQATAFLYHDIVIGKTFDQFSVAEQILLDKPV